MTTSPKRYDCFVIMPIGHEETEFLWSEIYRPLLEELGFDPKRSKENENGREMTGQIRNFIATSNLLIGDLTLARQNCYYEVGLAMGASREENLILCCREGDPIHFDISTYYVIRWKKDGLTKFKEELREKIGARKPSLQPIPIVEDEMDVGMIGKAISQIKNRLDNIYDSISSPETKPTVKKKDNARFYNEALGELLKWKKGT